MDDIPVVNIAPFLAGERSGKPQVVAQVKSACEGIGFFSIVGHAVPDDLIDKIRSVSNAFFDLPLEEKEKVKRISRPGSPPGYSVPGEVAHAKSLGTESPPDYQEGFTAGRPRIPDEPYWHTEFARTFNSPNVWPARPAEFRSVYEAYYAVMEGLAADIMRIFALALELDESYFKSRTDKTFDTLRVVRYPAQDVPPAEGQLRAGAHTDYGTLTILLAEDKPGGLQVRTREGKWIDVHPLPGSFVINIGDLMMQWTNDHWISNLHRVANPPRQFAAIPRLSVVFFHGANYDAEVRCIDKYAGAASAPKYPPTTAGAHFLSKQTKVRKTDATTSP